MSAAIFKISGGLSRRADTNRRMDDVTGDSDLLRRYADEGDAAAFATLVTRHTDMVYSAAVRQAGPGVSADDVTQATFVLLMRKADRLPPGTVVAGWLYKAVRFVALNARRAELRRRRHERKAGEMAVASNTPDRSGDRTWAAVAPLLDEAVARLSPADRAAVVLRYFERRSLAEVGQSLGVSEHAAQMRVTRAVEKLRDAFRRRGVTVTATALGVAVTAWATHAAPPGLAATLSVPALQSAGAAGPSAALADGASRGMLVAQARTAAALTLAVVTAVGLAVAIVRVAVDRLPAPGPSPAALVDPQAR